MVSEGTQALHCKIRPDQETVATGSVEHRLGHSDKACWLLSWLDSLALEKTPCQAIVIPQQFSGDVHRTARIVELLTADS